MQVWALSNSYVTLLDMKTFSNMSGVQDILPLLDAVAGLVHDLIRIWVPLPAPPAQFVALQLLSSDHGVQAASISLKIIQIFMQTD